MKLLKNFSALSLLLALCAGCTSTNLRNAAVAPTPGGGWQAWAKSQGGPLVDARQCRANAVCRKLTQGVITRPIAVHVLKTRDLTAFAWPDRNVFVSAGLVDALTDDELASALAHEIGHLLDNGRVASVQALSGGPSQDIEIRADHLGAELLADHGIDTQNMARMLAKVMKAQPADALCRPAIAKRIAILNATGR